MVTLLLFTVDRVDLRVALIVGGGVVVRSRAEVSSNSAICTVSVTGVSDMKVVARGTLVDCNTTGPYRCSMRIWLSMTSLLNRHISFSLSEQGVHTFCGQLAPCISWKRGDWVRRMQFDKYIGLTVNWNRLIIFMDSRF